MSSYVPAFLALVRRRGYSCEISDPELVSGSATPPPSRRYPGLVCYLVTVTVNGVEFHGYGPSVGLARQYAVFEAYKALSNRPTNEVINTREDDAHENDRASVSSHDGEDSVCGEPVRAESIEHLFNSLSLSAEDANENRNHDDQSDTCNERDHVRQQSTGSVRSEVDSPDHDKSSPDKDQATTDVPEDSSLAVITDNPVGQLQEMMLKNYQILPVFAESVQVNGKRTEFMCTVEIKGLCGRGIAKSKKLARRYASEDLLTVMKTRGININPPKKPKVIKKNHSSEPKPVNLRHCVSLSPDCGESRDKQCTRSASCDSLPADVYIGPTIVRSAHPKTHRQSSKVDRNKSAFLPFPVRRPLLPDPAPSPHPLLPLPLPRPLPPNRPSEPLLPFPNPQQALPFLSPKPLLPLPNPQRFQTHPTSNPLLPLPYPRPLLPLPPLQPLRVPTAEIVYPNVSDSDSENENDCTSISLGLCEVLPPDLQNSVVRGNEKLESRSLSSSYSRQEPVKGISSSTGNLETLFRGANHDMQRGATSISSDLHSNEHTSEMTSPFPAHSDPFQFTVRLPHSVGVSWSAPEGSDNSSVPSKSPPWKAFRSDPQTRPSTDYIYHRTMQNKHRLNKEKSVHAVEQGKDLISLNPKVGSETVHGISLPPHPLLTTMAEAHQAPCEQSSKSINEGNLASGAIDSIDYDVSERECNDAVLTESVSVGLPSEGSVSSSLLMQCNS